MISKLIFLNISKFFTIILCLLKLVFISFTLIFASLIKILHHSLVVKILFARIFKPLSKNFNYRTQIFMIYDYFA